MVTSTNAYDPFGKRTHTGTKDSAFGFSGNLTDVDTGLIYMRARDYDPRTGQFLTVDPALYFTGDPYAYVSNNPLLRIDPTGLWNFVSDDDLRNPSGHPGAPSERNWRSDYGSYDDRQVSVSAGLRCLHE
ncbi:RHS repeat-associated core domain-containing protein [Rhodoglobus sp.]